MRLGVTVGSIFGLTTFALMVASAPVITPPAILGALAVSAFIGTLFGLAAEAPRHGILVRRRGPALVVPHPGPGVVIHPHGPVLKPAVKIGVHPKPVVKTPVFAPGFKHHGATTCSTTSFGTTSTGRPMAHTRFRPH